MTTENQSNATIQWKGTDVCMDVHCSCGTHSHLDAESAYYVRCPNCRAVYKVGDLVSLTKVNDDEMVSAEEFGIIDAELSIPTIRLVVMTQEDIDSLPEV